MLKAYKVKLKTNNKQKTWMKQCLGASRYVYNWGLAQMQERYEKGEKTNPLKLCVEFNAKKREMCPWIVVLPYAVEEASFRNLDAAFKNFFRRCKKGETPGYPKFKKKGISNSFQLRGVKIFADQVYLPKLGNVLLWQKNYIPVNADYGIYFTISEKANEWYISVLVDNHKELPEKKIGNNKLGLDLGIKAAAVFSDGQIFENQKYFNKSEKKLAILQRELCRRKKGSANRNKTKQKISKLHNKIYNQRNFLQHKISNYAQNTDTIIMENLNVSGMVQNHKLAKAISDVGFYEIRRQVEYKAGWNGTNVIIADRFFASSKTCSNCGNKKDELNLSERIYKCDICGFELDRDLNAAINLSHYVV